MRVRSCLFTLAMAAPALAQHGASFDSAAQAEAIKRIAWMVGEWDGEAVVDRGPQGRSEVISWERVTLEAGGTALLVRGQHWTRKADGSRGDLVHDAVGMITFDAAKKTYRFAAQLANGQFGDFVGEADGAAFLWSFAVPRGRVRYRLAPDPQGRWQEVGEFCPEAQSSPCRQIFRMQLNRRADAAR